MLYRNMVRFVIFCPRKSCSQGSFLCSLLMCKICLGGVGWVSGRLYVVSLSNYFGCAQIMELFLSFADDKLSCLLSRITLYCKSWSIKRWIFLLISQGQWVSWHESHLGTPLTMWQKCMDQASTRPQPRNTQRQPIHTHLSTSSCIHLLTTHQVDTLNNVNDKRASAQSF